MVAGFDQCRRDNKDKPERLNIKQKTKEKDIDRTSPKKKKGKKSRQPAKNEKKRNSEGQFLKPNGISKGKSSEL